MAPQLINSQNYDTIKVVDSETHNDRSDFDHMINSNHLGEECIIEHTSSSIIFWCCTEAACLEIVKYLVKSGITCHYEFKQLGHNNYARLYPGEE